MKPTNKTIGRLVIIAVFMGAAFAAGQHLAPDNGGDVNVGLIFGVIASAAVGFCLIFLAETRAAIKRDRVRTLKSFKMAGLQLGCIVAALALHVVVHSIVSMLGLGETFFNIVSTAIFSGFVGLYGYLIMAEVYKDTKPFEPPKAVKITARCAAMGLIAGLFAATFTNYMGWSYTSVIVFVIGFVVGSVVGFAHLSPQMSQAVNDTDAKG